MEPQIHETIDYWFDLVAVDGALPVRELPNVVVLHPCPIDGHPLAHYHDLEWLRRIKDGKRMAIIPLINLLDDE